MHMGNVQFEVDSDGFWILIGFLGLGGLDGRFARFRNSRIVTKGTELREGQFRKFQML